MRYPDMLRELALVALVAVGLTMPSPAAAATKVRVGNLPISTTLPLYVGLEQGFFKEVDLDVEVVPNSGGAVAIPAMQGGSIDMTFSDFGSVLRANEQGLKLKILTPTTYICRDPVRDISHFLVLNDSPIHKLTDAKSKRVVVNLLGNFAHAYTVAALDQIGLKPGDYTVMELPYSQMVDALMNKQVDMIYQTEPFKTIMMKTGKVRDLGSAHYNVHQNFRVAGYITTDRWLAANADTARRFQQAYFKSARYVNQNANKLAEWYVKFFRMNPAVAAEVTPDIWDETMGDAMVASVTRTRDIMLTYGFLKTKLDPEALIVKPR